MQRYKIVISKNGENTGFIAWYEMLWNVTFRIQVPFAAPKKLYKVCNYIVNFIELFDFLYKG